MAVGDVYQVIDVQSLLGQTVLNIYFYEQRDIIVPLMGDKIAEVLAWEFNDQKVPFLVPVQSDQLTHVEIRALNLYDPEDFGIVPSDEPGTGTGVSVMSTFNTLSTKFTSNSRAIKSGGKRIAGVTEAMAEDGVISEEGTITAIGELDAELLEPINGGLIIEDPIWYPVLIKRLPVEEGGKIVGYRLPTTPEETTKTDIVNVLTSLLVSTMNTRKIGAGA